MKTDIALVTSLFEFHLTTISVILGIVGAIFILIGFISMSSFKKYTKESTNELVQEKIREAMNDKNLKKMIEEKLNEKIENYTITIDDVTNKNEKTL